MVEYKAAKKVLDITKELTKGTDTTRIEILEKAGRARALQIKRSLRQRRQNGVFDQLTDQEADLHVEIVTSLDQMSRRMPRPLPKSETDRVEALINELDKVRSTRQQYPVSPGISVWRGELYLKGQHYQKAFDEFSQAALMFGQIADDSPDEDKPLVGAGRVAATCEAAYSLAMLGKQKKSLAWSDKAIDIARQNRIEEPLMNRILRKHFVAGVKVTNPLPTAYFFACDTRINLTEVWDEKSQLASDFNVYWNLLNDQCGGLSSLQVPYLIAVLSDEKWMTKRPDLAAPIARELYLQTSGSISQGLWRRANLFIGGFRFHERIKRISSTSVKAAAIFLIAAIAFGHTVDTSSNISVLNNLSSVDVGTYFFDGGFTDAPSGSEIVEGLGLEDKGLENSQTIYDVISAGDMMTSDTSTQDLDIEVASGSSSLVPAKYV